MRHVALITGASRGIGAATASVLAERGFRVIVNHHASAQEAEEVVGQITADAFRELGASGSPLSYQELRSILQRYAPRRPSSSGFEPAPETPGLGAAGSGPDMFHHSQS